APAAQPGVAIRGRVPAAVLLSGMARRDGVADGERACARRLRRRRAALPVVRRRLHGAAVVAVIQAEAVSKRFLLRHNASVELKVRFLGLIHPDKRQKVEEFWALKGVSLSIDHGEAVGLVGRNGSGKSTFLKVVA